MKKKNKELLTYGLIGLGAFLIFKEMNKKDKPQYPPGYQNIPAPSNTNPQWWQQLLAQAPQLAGDIMNLVQSGQASSGEQAFAMIPGTNQTYDDFYMNL